MAKGKGRLVTYWLENSLACRRRGSNDGSQVSSSGGTLHGKELNMGDDAQDKLSRLVEWNVESLSRILKHIIARQNATQSGNETVKVVNDSILKRRHGTRRG